MNFRILATSVGPRGRLLALLAATALALSFAPDARAQAPAPGAPPPVKKAAPKAPKAPPKAAPAPVEQPAPAAQAPAGGQAQAPAGGAQGGAPAQPQDQQVQLIYSPWTKFCVKGQEADAKQLCITGKDGRLESGMPVVAAVVIESEADPTKKMLRITLPLSMALVHGTRIVVDDAQPVRAPYVACLNNGCISDYEATPEMLANLKKGQNLVVQAIQLNGAALQVALPLAEFAKAFEGPPTDPKQFEEQQRKLQEELQKKADEARKKLEQANPGGANPAAK